MKNPVEETAARAASSLRCRTTHLRDHTGLQLVMKPPLPRARFRHCGASRNARRDLQPRLSPWPGSAACLDAAARQHRAQAPVACDLVCASSHHHVPLDAACRKRDARSLQGSASVLAGATVWGQPSACALKCVLGAPAKKTATQVIRRSGPFARVVPHSATNMQRALRGQSWGCCCGCRLAARHRCSAPCPPSDAIDRHPERQTAITGELKRSVLICKDRVMHPDAICRRIRVYGRHPRRPLTQRIAAS